MRKRGMVVGLFCILLVIVACATTFTQGIYREQATSLSSYKIINGTITDLRSQGLVTDDGWKKYADMANKFLDKHKEVSLAMVAYSNGQGTQGAVELAQKSLLEALNVLKEYYFKTVSKDKQKPLF
jgi:hypothetical protein